MNNVSTVKKQNMNISTLIRINKWWRKNKAPLLMVMPFVILMIYFVVMPVIMGIALSFTNYNMINPPKWTGIINYKNLFTQDEVFLKHTLKNTLIFAGVIGPLGYILSFMFAWIVDQLKGRNVFALAFYAPSITSQIAMSIVWMMIFSADRYGYINYFLIYVLQAVSEPVLFTRDPNFIPWVVIIISLWMSMGTGFLVHLAGFRNIPRQMYEAAAIDGIKNKFQELIYITIPNVMPQLLFSAIMTIVSALGVYQIPAQVAGMPSPEYSAHTIIAHVFDYAFLRFEMGYASAVAVILFVISFLIGRFFMRIFRSRDIEDRERKKIFFKVKAGGKK